MSTTMTTLEQRLIAELANEAGSTRKVLERVPEDRLSWAPHPKSMTLGQLAQHVAVLPGAIAGLLAEADTQVPNVPRPEATSVADLLGTLDWSVSTATAALAGWGEAGLLSEWRLLAGEEMLMTMPRIDAVRAIMLNHWYHHRGQLVVYLRLLEIPVPAVYGDSADEPALQPEGRR